MIIAIRKLLWNEVGALELLIILNKRQKTRSNITKKKLPLEVGELRSNDGMHKSSSNDGTKSGLVCLGFSGSEISLLVELSSAIGARSGGGKRGDEARDEWQSTSQNRGGLGANLTKFALQECGATDNVDIEQALNGRQFEYAGFVGSCICWVLDESKATSSNTFDEAHKRDEEQLVANEQL